MFRDEGRVAESRTSAAAIAIVARESHTSAAGIAIDAQTSFRRSVWSLEQCVHASMHALTRAWVIGEKEGEREEGTKEGEREEGTKEGEREEGMGLGSGGARLRQGLRV